MENNKCDNCDNEVIEFFCEECKEYLCHACNEQNHKMGKKSLHHRSQTSIRYAKVDVEEVSTCVDHPNELLFWFCQTCFTSSG